MRGLHIHTTGLRADTAGYLRMVVPGDWICLNASVLLLLGPVVATGLLLVSTLLVVPFVFRILWRIAPIVFLAERRPYRHGDKCRGEGIFLEGDKDKPFPESSECAMGRTS